MTEPDRSRSAAGARPGRAGAAYQPGVAGRHGLTLSAFVWLASGWLAFMGDVRGTAVTIPDLVTSPPGAPHD